MMELPLTVVEKQGYVATIYTDDTRVDMSWLEVTYGDERIVFLIQVRSDEQLDELVDRLEKIKVNTLEKLLDLKKVMGFSAGRVLRYIEAGAKMDLFFSLFSATIVITLSALVFMAIVYSQPNRILVLAGIFAIGLVISCIFFFLFKKYRGRLKYDK